MSKTKEHIDSARAWIAEAEEGLEMLFAELNKNPIMESFAYEALRKLRTGIAGAEGNLSEASDELDIITAQEALGIEEKKSA